MTEIHVVTCKQCGGESPHDAQYCIECGETLGSVTGATTKLATPTCQSCRSENLPDARFCAMCGRSLPGDAAVPQQWPNLVGLPKQKRMPVPQPVQLPQPQVSPRPMPVAQAQPRPLPMPQPVPQPVMPTTAPKLGRRRHRHGGLPPAALVAIIGFGALIVLKAVTWPLIMVVVAAIFLVQAAEHGRIEQALRTVAMVAAGMFVFSNPRFWPILLIGFGLMKLFGGRRVF